MQNIKQIRSVSGLEKAEFCFKYGIPIRTLEDWEAGRRKPQGYVTSLLERVVKEDSESTEISLSTKPFLKWAGGKTQMLNELVPLIPNYTGKYIEPFIGGGALFFALQPDNAIIADSNPELINAYQQLAQNVEKVITQLKRYKNSEEEFYAVRKQNWKRLSKEHAAARTIYLNHTCFNGLYRVNHSGGFNVPFGKYKNPTICDANNLRNVSKALKTATIICGDYKDVLIENAKLGDFIFLDPPYVPISSNSDFKRYTKEEFYEKDQRELAKLVSDLHKRGCYVLLTNSDAPLVHELYDEYQPILVNTKRYISSNSNTRTGRDLIVNIVPETEAPDIQVSKFPSTRYMGSKQKLLDYIWEASSGFNANSVIDLFSGSGAVGYMFKAHGMKVISNDYMHMSYIFAKAMIENNHVTLKDDIVESLLKENNSNDKFVEKNFKDLYFTDEDNLLIDTIRANIKTLSNEYEKDIALTALIRSCMKKRPRGLFTYVGLNKYNDGRKDLKLSFEDQFRNAVAEINKSVFDNKTKCGAFCTDSLELNPCITADIVYIDPPYFSKYSDNQYVRRYHFLEGLARDWNGVEIQENTKTHKFKSYPSLFSTKNGSVEAFNKIFDKYKDSVLIVSYSSNSYPDEELMIELLKKYKENVKVIPIEYTYSFGNQKKAVTHNNRVQEYLFIAS
jgi:DNA adenine methylase